MVQTVFTQQTLSISGGYTLFYHAKVDYHILPILKSDIKYLMFEESTEQHIKMHSLSEKERVKVQSRA